MPATLHDVARRAKVSIKTVSRVVNNEDRVKESTRQRVLAAIEELGYQPNILARGLVQQRSFTIAVVSWRLDKPGPSHFVMGVEEETNRLGYSIMLTLLRARDAERVDVVLNNLISRQVDGIIWHVPKVGSNQDWINKERLMQLPPVVLNSLPNNEVTTVSIDNCHGAKVAVQHLIDQGWRRIGFVSGPLDNPIYTEKLRGWRECLKENGIEPDDVLVSEDQHSVQGGDCAGQRLLEMAPDVDAVFAGNDWMALGAMAAFRSAGRKVNYDFGIIGYGDHAESGYFIPPLSTVHQDIFELGQHAVRHLIEIINARSQPENGHIETKLTVLKPHLVVRESSLKYGTIA